MSMESQSKNMDTKAENGLPLSVGHATGKDLQAALSETMQLALAYAKAHGGGLARQPGGFWVGADEANSLRSNYFGTSTVQALVTRGVLTYDKWQETRHGSFPIRAALAACEAVSGAQKPNEGSPAVLNPNP